MNGWFTQAHLDGFEVKHDTERCSLRMNCYENELLGTSMDCLHLPGLPCASMDGADMGWTDMVSEETLGSFLDDKQREIWATLVS